MLRSPGRFAYLQQNRRHFVDYLAGRVRDGANLNKDDNTEDLPPEIEAVMLAVWRRVVKEGGGPELTLPEAAVLLGTSVESVRRRIKSGQIRAFRDQRGRVRVSASVTNSSHEHADATVIGLWQELKTAKHELASTASEANELRQELGLAHFHRREAQHQLQSLEGEAQALRAELESARTALEHTQTELAAMWRVMSTRKTNEATQRFGVTDGNEAFDLPPDRLRLESERSRIQNQITRVRDLSRKRRWPWPQAS
jgi:excisionase family DNA binding protein